MGDTTKKKMKLNMPLEEFAKLTPEEKAEYKRQGDEMSKKTKDAYKKTKEAPFNTGGKVKGYEHGGSVKGKKMNKCRMDGIAIRGKTRAKERSK